MLIQRRVTARIVAAEMALMTAVASVATVDPVSVSSVVIGDYAVTATTAIPQVSSAALDQAAHRIFPASLADDEGARPTKLCAPDSRRPSAA